MPMDAARNEAGHPEQQAVGPEIWFGQQPLSKLLSYFWVQDLPVLPAPFAEACSYRCGGRIIVQMERLPGQAPDLASPEAGPRGNDVHHRPIWSADGFHRLAVACRIKQPLELFVAQGTASMTRVHGRIELGQMNQRVYGGSPILHQPAGELFGCLQVLVVGLSGPAFLSEVAAAGAAVVERQPRRGDRSSAGARSPSGPSRPGRRP